MQNNSTPTGKKPTRTFLYTFIIGLYRIFARIVFFVRIEGREHIPSGKPCILMGNHQCVLDPFMLAICASDREIHFMGKKELFANRFLARFFTKLHGFPVDRGNIDMSAMRTALSVLKEGDTLGIFPEGTRSRDGHMLPLQGGASLLALRSRCDVVPVYIDGDYRPFHRITVRVGKPLSMSDLLVGRVTKESCDELTSRMQAAFTVLSGGKSLPTGREKENEAFRA